VAAGGASAAPAPQSGAAAGAAPKDANVHHLAKCITCHAWSADRTRLALCPNDNTVEIWAFDGSAWNKEHVLDEVREENYFFCSEKRKK
jgi:WD40 repeat protein